MRGHEDRSLAMRAHHRLLPFQAYRRCRGMASLAEFAEALVETIQRNHAAIAREGQQGRMLEFVVTGMKIWIFLLPPRTTGSDIDYARRFPDMTEFASPVRACLDDKAPKLKAYSCPGERGAPEKVLKRLFRPCGYFLSSACEPQRTLSIA